MFQHSMAMVNWLMLVKLLCCYSVITFKKKYIGRDVSLSPFQMEIFSGTQETC